MQFVMWQIYKYYNTIQYNMLLSMAKSPSCYFVFAKCSYTRTANRNFTLRDSGRLFLFGTRTQQRLDSDNVLSSFHLVHCHSACVKELPEPCPQRSFLNVRLQTTQSKHGVQKHSKQAKRGQKQQNLE